MRNTDFSGSALRLSRADKRVLIEFRDVNYHIALNGVSLEDRHALFNECVKEARKGMTITGNNSINNKIKKKKHIAAQILFIEKVRERYSDFFVGGRN